MRQEIGEQPEVLARTVAELSHRADALASTLVERGISTIVTCGRGSSHNVARYAAYALAIQGGCLVADAAPSVVTAYGARPSFADTCLLAISQSGGGEDLLAVAGAAAEAGAPVAAITNEPAAAIAQLADHLLLTPAGPELSVPATKTYTSAVTAVALLAAALQRLAQQGSADADSGGFAALPAAVSAVLEREDELAAVGRKLRRAQRCVVLGRGYNRATASEVALKIQETSYLSAQDYGAPEFLHGPMAVVEPGFEVVAIVAAGPTATAVLDVCRRARDLGGRVTLISDRPLEPRIRAEIADATVELDLDLPEALSPVPLAVCGQLVALHLATSRGSSPDRPRSLSKVTATR
jgi:glucosamine--fructose-6-phosphate aminotransferase (isomerizing)